MSLELRFAGAVSGFEAQNRCSPEPLVRGIREEEEGGLVAVVVFSDGSEENRGGFLGDFSGSRWLVVWSFW